MSRLPSGTVTFLFTDIEGSTKLAQSLGGKWETLRARHHEILKSAIESNNGYVFQIIGDAFCASFHTAGDAVRAAAQAQIDFHNEDWGETPVKIRIGINTGTAQASIDTDHSGGYKGYTAMARVQRIMSSGHGGQVLISFATEELVRDELPENVSLQDMGECRFKDLIRPERIHQLVIEGLPVDFPPLKTLDAYRHNLPIQLTSFIGRETEMDEISQKISEHHLVTLAGVGGTGKTRLSLQVSADLVDSFPDGVWFVQLAPVVDPTLVPRTTAMAIGLRDEPQRPVIDMLCDYLRSKKMLIILDNCEHLVEACAQLADRILHAAPNVHILASSRETLGVPGEITYLVQSLDLPDMEHLPSTETLSQYEAVKLFIDRATSAVSSFKVTNENAPALAQICHRLDGIPLAIELAAAKIRVLSVEQIARRLDDRFRLLTGGSRTALERHQTLRTAVDWSYNLLLPEEQSLLRKLSIFVGGWTLEAAESVCEDESNADVLDLLEQLINKSLVITEEQLGESRYHMLETIRQYAKEKLIDAQEIVSLRDKHLEYFLDLAETAAPYLIRTEQLEWLARLDTDHENLRAALKWADSKETAEASLRLCAALGKFWYIRGYWIEGSQWLTKAFAMPVQDQNQREKNARLRALHQDTELAERLDDDERRYKSAKLSLSLAQEIADTKDIAIAKFYFGFSLYVNMNYAEALPYIEQSLQEFQHLNDLYWEAYTNRVYDVILLYKNELTTQQYYARVFRGLAEQRKAGDRHHLAMKLYEYSKWLYINEQFEEAKKYLEEADTLYRQLGENINVTYNSMGAIAWVQGDYPLAKKLLTEYQEKQALLGEKNFSSRTLEMLGRIAIEENDLHQAQVYLDEALALARESENKFNTSIFLATLSRLSYLQGDIENFKEYLSQSIAAAKNIPNSFKAILIENILSSPFFQISHNSILLLGVLDQYNKENERLINPVYKRYHRQVETNARETLGEEAFESAFADGQKLSLDDALDLVLKSLDEE